MNVDKVFLWVAVMITILMFSAFMALEQEAEASPELLTAQSCRVVNINPKIWHCNFGGVYCFIYIHREEMPHAAIGCLRKEVARK